MLGSFLNSLLLFNVQRYQIVNGEIEVEGAPNESTEDKPADEKTPPSTDVEKGVPNFWLTAMKNNEVLVEEVGVMNCLV
jgi:nucleosome assembly protein 1-like 1